MSVRTTIWLITTLASGICGFVDLIKIPLDARIALLVLSGILTLLAIARPLKNWCGVEVTTTLGFRTIKPAPRKVGVAVLALCLPCLAVVALLCVATTYHSIVYGSVESTDSTDVLFRAARPIAAQVLVQYPPARVNVCTPFDPDLSHRATLYLIAPDGPNPQAVITNFSYPERFGLRCKPPAAVDRFQLVAVPPMIRALSVKEVHSKLVPALRAFLQFARDPARI